MPEALSLALSQVGILLLLMRVGILSTVTLFLLASAIFQDLPATLELTAWHGQPTILFLVLVTGLSLYGFYVSLGGRPLLGETLLSE